MGMKRDIDTGRVDSLGRPIKVSSQQYVNQDKKIEQLVDTQSRINEIQSKIADFKRRSTGSAEEQIAMSGDIIEFLSDDDVWENSPDEAMRIAHEHGLKNAVLLGVLSQVGKGTFGASLGGGTKRCKGYKDGEDKWEKHLDERDFLFSDRPFPRSMRELYIDSNDNGDFLVAKMRGTPGEVIPSRKGFIDSGRKSSRYEDEIVDLVNHLGYDVKVDHQLTLDKFCYHNDHGGWEFGDVNYNKRIAPDLILPNEKVIIEVDGGNHHLSNIMDDVERTYRMSQMGWKVIRVRWGQNMFINKKKENIDIPYATNIHHRSDGQVRSDLKRAIEGAIEES